jgi:hypothetical protein
MVRICELQPNNNEAESGLTAIEKNEPTTTDLFAGGI